MSLTQTSIRKKAETVTFNMLPVACKDGDLIWKILMYQIKNMVELKTIVFLEYLMVMEAEK